MKRILAVLAVLSMVCIEGRAQFASLGGENGNIRWETLTSNNYKVLFPVGLDSLGMRYSTLMEQYRPLVGNSVGLYPNQFYRRPMPVILHPYAAISNGAVVWAPRRMDIYTFPDAYGSLPPVPWEKILAIHENRHVAQNQFTRASYKKYYYWPFGEIGLALAGTLFENAALFEGDAVVAETALTNSGRGRSADFLSYIRMSFAEGDMRDWFRWRYGSQRWYTPDYYKIGYMTVAGMRYNYDATMFMADYLWNLGSPFAFNAVQKTMKKYSGKRIKGTWNEIATTFKDIWARDDSLRAPFQEIVPLVPASKYFTSYRGTVQTSDGRVFALRAALNRQQELVERLPDGRAVPVRPMNVESKLVYSAVTNCIYWSEAIPDLRWDMIQTSRIRFLSVGSTKIKDLTSGGRFVNPAVSPDGYLMAAVEYPVKGGSRIVLLSLPGGQEIKSIPVPDGLQATEVAFLDNNHIAFTGISDGGMGLYETDFSTIRTYEEAVPVKINDLISRNGVLYFSCDRTGTSEVYSYIQGTLTQLTNTRHGATSPFFNSGALSFSALQPSGRLLATVEEPLERVVSLSDYASYPVADQLSSQEKEFAARTEESSGAVRGKYYKVPGFFHIHSWVPVYFNWDGFSSSESEYFYQTASPGATFFFQNLTGTASGSIGVSAHSDPFDEIKTMTGFHARIKYTGLYPVFDLAIDAGDRQPVEFSRGLIVGTDSTFVNVSPESGVFVGGSLGVTVPLDFSSGGRETKVEPGLTIKSNNDTYKESFLFYDDKGALLPGHRPSGEGRSDEHYNNSSVTLRLTAFSKRAMAPSQIVPRSGVGGELRYIHSFFNRGLGSGYYINAYAYVPSVFPSNGIKLSATFQHKKQVFETWIPKGKKISYLLPADVWGLGFEDIAPRGFDKTGAGATMLLMSPVSSILSLDYVFPTLFFDTAFTPYVYVSNLEINPFADFSFYKPDNWENLFSIGADVVFRFEKLFMFSNTMKLGIRAAYNGGSQLYDSMDLKSPFYFGFVANTEL